MRRIWLATAAAVVLAPAASARADVYDDNPAAVTFGGEVYVFAHNADNRIIVRHTASGTWTGWTPIPGLEGLTTPGASSGATGFPPTDGAAGSTMAMAGTQRARRRRSSPPAGWTSTSAEPSTGSSSSGTTQCDGLEPGRRDADRLGARRDHGPAWPRADLRADRRRPEHQGGQRERYDPA